MYSLIQISMIIFLMLLYALIGAVLVMSIMAIITHLKRDKAYFRRKINKFIKKWWNMGLILDIVNKVVPRTLNRLEKEGGMLKDILSEELKKEIAHSLTDQSIENESMKPLQNIITDKEDIDNNEIYDIESGQTISEL